MTKWHCLACGYVHTGDQPPERCPWCGAPAKQFERSEVGALHRQTEGKTMKTFICSVCGYRHDGAEPPDYCPDCGAPRERFVEI